MTTTPILTLQPAALLDAARRVSRDAERPGTRPPTSTVDLTQSEETNELTTRATMRPSEKERLTKPEIPEDDVPLLATQRGETDDREDEGPTEQGASAEAEPGTQQIE